MMMMEAQDEVKDNSHIIKGKRTKRQRPLSPLALTMASSSSSSAGENGGGGSGRVVSESSGGFVDGGVITASPTTSNEFTAETDRSTEEEEDMANCLILLARGHNTTTTGRKIQLDQPVTTSLLSGSTKGGGGGGGLYVYQCKTCNRCFPSFQALGGHRASHKKPKAASASNNNNNNNIMDDKKGLVFMDAEENVDHFNHAATTTLSLQLSNNSSRGGGLGHSQSKANKLHECSICGVEFTSGQALGGHMRRHRTFFNTTATTTTTTSSPQSQHESKKARNINLQLDLNLPAPEDDRLESSKFPFAAKEQVIVFSASPLVDCHY